jgi:hypothetical protein
MEINFSNGKFANVGMGFESQAANAVGAGSATGKPGAAAAGREAVTFTNAPSGLVSSEPVADIPDAALLRDDALGNVVNSAFNLPPPPMPAFTD